MGKSTAAAILGRWGVAVVDTDDIARAVVAPGQPALDEIREAFGAGMIRGDGTLDRGRLAEAVFGDAEARRRLEGILHPRIRGVWWERVGEWRGRGIRCGVVVIPLLFETGAEGRFDAVVCVACSPATQRRRLLDRGWSEAHLQRRLSAQMPVETKILRSRFLIWTEPPVAVHEAQWRAVFATLGLLAG